MSDDELYTDNEHVPVVRHPGGWAMAFVHYTADPAKDGEWVEKMRARGDVEDWEKEMEINFQSVEGVRCFDSFSLISNTDNALEFDETLPLCLCCDFNTSPMAWCIAQVHDNEMVHFVDEIFLKEGSTPRACEEFLNRYGDFYGELRIYGDRSGKGGSTGDHRSDYDIMRTHFRQFPFTVRMKVPSKNPTNVNAVASMNARLKDKFGNPRIKINPKACPHLIKDMVEVVWDDNKNKNHIKKEHKRERGPYFWRTHMSDAAMYFIYREWPTRKELSRQTEAEKRHEREKDMRKLRKKKRRLIGAFPD